MNIAEIVEKLNLPHDQINLDYNNELWMPCPLPFGNHVKGDQNPSFSINMETGNCYCFVCGGGSLLYLVSSILGISHDEAKAWIRGTELGDESDAAFSKRIREKLCNNV